MSDARDRARERVWIIEDDPDSRNAVARFLRLHGYQVLAERGGDAALERLRRKRRPDLIVLDFWLSGDASAFLDEKRSCEADDVPVLMLSGDDEDEGGSLKACVEHLVKPYEPDALLAAVKRACAGRVPEEAALQRGERLSAREQLLAAVSHELRTPLSAVSMVATKLIRRAARREGSDEIIQDGEAILRSVRQMDRMLRDLLDAAPAPEPVSHAKTRMRSWSSSGARSMRRSGEPR